MAITIKYSTYAWYEDFQFELPLIKTYVSKIESQVTEVIQDYRKNKELIVEKNPEFGDALIDVVHEGLLDSDYSLESVYEEYFPSLQRGGALIVLNSFAEFKFNSLCAMYQEERKLRISPKDLKGNGMKRSYDYLKKVVELDINTNSVAWSELMKIQRIRHLFAHNDGKGKEKVEQYIRDSPTLSLSGRGEVVILEGFLDHTLESFDSFFKEINASIQAERPV